MELHVVFYKKAYGPVNALKHQDGLAVLAFFFVIAQKPNPSYVEVSKLLKRIVNPYESASFEDPLALEDMLHSNLHDYYVYNGKFHCTHSYPVLFLKIHFRKLNNTTVPGSSDVARFLHTYSNISRSGRNQ
jgi:hypothetical protein